MQPLSGDVLPLRIFLSLQCYPLRFKRTGKRSEIFLASKFAINPATGKVDGSPENVKNSVELSLKRLDVDYIDLYYVHRCVYGFQ